MYVQLQGNDLNTVFTDLKSCKNCFIGTVQSLRYQHEVLFEHKHVWLKVIKHPQKLQNFAMLAQKFCREENVPRHTTKTARNL